MDTETTKQGLWVPRRASTSCAACSPPTSPSAASQNFPADVSAPSSPASTISAAEVVLPKRRDSRVRNPGKKIGQVVKLRPECVAEYKACHAKVWPEVLKQIRECGIRDCKTPSLLPRTPVWIFYQPKRELIRGVVDSIFHDAPSGLLFATFTYVGYGFADDMERMRENPRVREWWKLTDGMQESLVEGATGSAEGAWWREVEAVFYAA